VIGNTSSCGALAQAPPCFGPARFTATARFSNALMSAFLLLVMLQWILDNLLITALMTTAFAMMPRKKIASAIV